MNTLGNFFKSKINIFATVGVVFDCPNFNHFVFFDCFEILVTPIVVINCENNVLSEFDFHD